MVDFKRIISDRKLYNFHSHTQFCDGRAVMEDFVKAAVELGFTDYGFSPHSPIPFASPCNMSHEAVKEYIAEFHRLYPQIEITIEQYSYKMLMHNLHPSERTRLHSFHTKFKLFMYSS